MAGRIGALAKCELRSFIRFLQANGWFVENDQRSCFWSDFMRLRRAILTSGDVFIHNNTHPHSAAPSSFWSNLNASCLIIRRIAPT
ncbi:hypothetical protein AVEN_249363-1 [Araneus ventricosus]|uniref:Uncharacterized protein n=1 Tax=Araneus ventricosus TaxID=182803 RepID=A0A4Y2UVF2_ARAVE|nr:hypothetical protein AVEN_249363-1 [Araneus ventricosus]